MPRSLQTTSVWILVLMMLTLAACVPQMASLPTAEMLLSPSAQQMATPAQATLAALQAQEQNGADAQAAATAEIMRVNAQATLNASSSTLSAAQTQEQNNANIIAAQVAATAEIVRANAQATINSAASTQGAALTQDAIHQTQAAALVTSSAAAIAIQQGQDALVAGTQTAVADNIATQTQAAVATSQWYADQERQRDEQRGGPITFLWMWCLPTFIVLFAGLILWGFWRWLRIQQANQRIPEKPLEQLPAATFEGKHRRHDDVLPYLDGDASEEGYQLTKPDDHVSEWLDEVKHTLLSNDEKDKDDNPDS